MLPLGPGPAPRSLGADRGPGGCRGPGPGLREQTAKTGKSVTVSHLLPWETTRTAACCGRCPYLSHCFVKLSPPPPLLSRGWQRTKSREPWYRLPELRGRPELGRWPRVPHRGPPGACPGPSVQTRPAGHYLAWCPVRFLSPSVFRSRLGNNRITAAGAQVLAQGLRANASLQFLG